MRLIWQRYRREETGAVSVSASFLIGILIVLFGGGVELMHSYWQSNTMQHAAKRAARIAATGAPVSLELKSMTGLDGQVNAGDPMPDYKIVCSGKTQACNRGGFDQSAFNKILFGRDEDGVCGPTTDERRGVCDVLDTLTAENLTITYESSGMGRAGTPADIIPLVTVIISDVEKNYIFLDLINAPMGTGFLSAKAMSIAEDLE